ncbi:unnamed protein product [Sympodiomycopsis kandeliae]
MASSTAQNISHSERTGSPNPSTNSNPYLGHRQLTEKEANLLGEYHRLSQTLRRIVQVSNRLSAAKQHAQTLDELRMVERKMGLVLTLYQSSVFSIVLEQEEKQRAQEEARRILEEEEDRMQRLQEDQMLHQQQYGNDHTETYEDERY